VVGTVIEHIKRLESIGVTNFEGYKCFRCLLAPMILHNNDLIHSSKLTSI
jgi:hypothetical protein